MDNKDKVKTLLAEQFGVSSSDIPDDAAINQMPEWDSFSHLNLMLHLEQTFGVGVNEETIIQATTVSGLCDLIADSQSPE